MAKTQFNNGDILTPVYMDTIYGSGPGGGHLHDGVDADGHAHKIDLDIETSGVLPLAKMTQVDLGSTSFGGTQGMLNADRISGLSAGAVDIGSNQIITGGKTFNALYVGGLGVTGTIGMNAVDPQGIDANNFGSALVTYQASGPLGARASKVWINYQLAQAGKIYIPDAAETDTLYLDLLIYWETANSSAPINSKHLPFRLSGSVNVDSCNLLNGSYSTRDGKMYNMDFFAVSDFTVGFVGGSSMGTAKLYGGEDQTGYATRSTAIGLSTNYSRELYIFHDASGWYIKNNSGSAGRVKVTGDVFVLTSTFV